MFRALLSIVFIGSCLQGNCWECRTYYDVQIKMLWLFDWFLNGQFWYVFAKCRTVRYLEIHRTVVITALILPAVLEIGKYFDKVENLSASKFVDIRIIAPLPCSSFTFNLDGLYSLLSLHFFFHRFSVLNLK